MKNNDKSASSEKELLIAKKMSEQLLSKRILNDIEKFHQSTTWQVPYNWTFNSGVIEWEKLVEYKDILPDNPLDTIEMFPNYKIPNYNYPQSTRHFKKDKYIDKSKIADILGKAFGRYEGLGSKNYGSAGGLYPVIPVMIVFSNNEIQDIDAGVYVYDSEHYSLQLIKKISNKKDFKMLSINVNSAFPGQLLSNICFAYAIDLERAILKYGRRGYRHALIESGLIAESLHLSHVSCYKEFGDCIWSGFNDNALTRACGLNAKMTPVTLLQWFGLKDTNR